MTAAARTSYISVLGKTQLACMQGTLPEKRLDWRVLSDMQQIGGVSVGSS